MTDLGAMEKAWEAASRSVVGGVDPEDFARGWAAARRVSPAELEKVAKAMRAEYDAGPEPLTWQRWLELARAALKALGMEVGE